MALDEHLAAWQAEPAVVDFTARRLTAADAAQVHDVARRLAEAMPGRRNDLPTPVRQGTRCTITNGGITATGTIQSSWTAPDPISRVELDGTGQLVEVPWSMLGTP